ncbi:toprim domain-containing protein [Novosphingobium sp.]|uniref:toprim domain-containing protein n=1 Tax=Novosphingobium sp. TaxID=1874826 RepID=UPI003FA5C5E2
MFCEGYATGATIHELTGWCVIVCFDAGNLPVVAEIMRKEFAQAAFIIAADNDAWTKAGDIENPGLHYAKRAADATRGFMIAPKFQDVSSRPTDWNDLVALEGDAVARAQLLANPVVSRPDTTGTDVVVAAPANDNVQYDQLPHVNGKGNPPLSRSCIRGRRPEGHHTRTRQCGARTRYERGGTAGRYQPCGPVQGAEREWQSVAGNARGDPAFIRCASVNSRSVTTTALATVSA